MAYKNKRLAFISIFFIICVLLSGVISGYNIAEGADAGGSMKKNHVSKGVMADNTEDKLSCDVVAAGSECEKVRTGYIYTGDSRMRRMNLTIRMSKMKDTWVYSKSGRGYSWFVGDSLGKIKDTMKKHPKIDRWVIVSGWGVNDLGNINSYLRTYKELLYQDNYECKLYLMSVNPVNGRMRGRYSGIGYFNNRLKAFAEDNAEHDVYYIDTYSKLMTGGFGTLDGLHYTERTNRRIYDAVREELDRTNAYINYTDIEMNVGAVRTITVGDVYRKVNWTVSDKNIVRITSRKGEYGQKAVITGRKKGKCTVSASTGNIKLSCKVVVKETKTLIAYYSYSGNTEETAEYIHNYAGGDIVAIEPFNEYPSKLSALKKQVKKEMADYARPAIDNSAVDMGIYDEIYIGFPIWYGYAPRVVCSFLDGCTGIEGKTIYCFMTSDSGDTGDCINELQAIYNTAVFNSCINIKSSDVLTSSSKERIRDWFDGSDSD